MHRSSLGTSYFDGGVTISLDIHTKEAPQKDVALATHKTMGLRADVDFAYEFLGHVASEERVSIYLCMYVCHRQKTAEWQTNGNQDNLIQPLHLTCK